MGTFWVEQLFTGEAFLDRVLVSTHEGEITAITPESEPENHPQLAGILAPGFIDLQVNGGGGALFCQKPSVVTIATMVQVHRQFGTHYMMPTVITSDWSVIQRAAAAVSDYLSQGCQGVLGIHFEGPHLYAQRAGIHNPQRFVGLSDKHLALYTQKDLGKVLLTLAPETVPSDVIGDLVQQGVVVSLGHSNADYDSAQAALAAGASSVTHLYNAMSPLQSRAPGLVGAALASDATYAGIIADGHHVHPAAIKAAVKALGRQRAYLVTDAMAHVGANQTTLPFEDQLIHRSGGKLTTANGTLAGSALTMNQAVANCYQQVGLSKACALTMATLTPAKLLGMDHRVGRIDVGHKVSMNLLDTQFNVDSPAILNG